MARITPPWLSKIGIGGRLFLAFVLISLITIIASVLTTNTYAVLSNQLLALKHQDIPSLDAAARLNDKSRLIVATAPLLATSDSHLSREQAMTALNEAIDEMYKLMRNLPGYNSYFRELITQIQDSLSLLNQSVEHREEIRRKLDKLSRQVFPLFQPLINELESQYRTSHSMALGAIINRLYYFSGMAEKINNDTSFNELDYTFIRLEQLGSQIQQRLPKTLEATLVNEIHALLKMGSRQGELFQLKNQELSLIYQQSFFLENSQDHIHQLAAQINRHTNQTNTSIRDSLETATLLIRESIRSILLLSLISLLVAGAVSWFYVQRNVLQRIIELQRNMRAIASSQLDKEVRVIGDDEVSSMAQDLKHFQDTAIEIKRTNLRLAAEIEERIAAEAQLQTTQHELIQAGILAALGQLLPRQQQTIHGLPEKTISPTPCSF